jgi:hypothetical protein
MTVSATQPWSELERREFKEIALSARVVYIGGGIQKSEFRMRESGEASVF